MPTRAYGSSPYFLAGLDQKWTDDEIDEPDQKDAAHQQASPGEERVDVLAVRKDVRRLSRGRSVPGAARAQEAGDREHQPQDREDDERRPGSSRMAGVTRVSRRHVSSEGSHRGPQRRRHQSEPEQPGHRTSLGAM